MFSFFWQVFHCAILLLKFLAFCISSSNVLTHAPKSSVAHLKKKNLGSYIRQGLCLPKQNFLGKNYLRNAFIKLSNVAVASVLSWLDIIL